MPALATLSDHQIQSLDQGLELGMAEGDGLARGRRERGKPAAFQALAPYAVATCLEIQTLELRPSSVDEEEAVAAQRVMPQLTPHNGCQAIIDMMD